MTRNYEIRWKKSAIKEIRRIEKNDRERILEAVGELTEDPFHRGVKKIVNMESTYRIRAGSYRVVYTIFKTMLVVEIIRVRHRREAYR